MRWIYGIAAYIMLSGLLLEVISDTKYYKFARWVTGVILLLQFVEPVTELSEGYPKFMSGLTSFEYALGTDKVLEEIYRTEDETKNSVRKSYEAAVSEQIDTLLRKNSLRLEQAEMEMDDSGVIRRLTVTARYLDGTEQAKKISIPTVAPVEIGRKAVPDTVSPMELYIREQLAEFYHMEENNIEVEIWEAD